MSTSADNDIPPKHVHPLLFRVAFAIERPAYCFGCICLTNDERAYQRRVFGLARTWSKKFNPEHKGLMERLVWSRRIGA